MADPTLIKKLRSIEHSEPGDDFPEWMEHPRGWAVPLSQLCKQAADALEQHWRPIATAPVEPKNTVPGYYRFVCLVQWITGPAGRETLNVGEAEAYYVSNVSNSDIVRWRNKHGQIFPVAWMPLPAPSIEHARSKP